MGPFLVQKPAHCLARGPVRLRIYPEPISSLAYPFHLGVEAAAMELYRAEKIATVEDQPSKNCRFCDDKLKHVRTVVVSDTGVAFHMFECQCGERIWVE